MFPFFLPVFADGILWFANNSPVWQYSIGDLLKGQPPASWGEAEEKVKNVLRKRGAEMVNVPPMVDFKL